MNYNVSNLIFTLFDYHQPKHCTCFEHVKFVKTLDDTSSLRKRLGSTEANLNISLNGAIIEQVKSHKLLGIDIEQDRDFDAQSDAYVNRYQRKLDFSSTLVHT